MNKKILIGAIIAIVVLGAIFYVAKPKTDSPNITNQEQSNETNSQMSQGTIKSLMDISNGKPQVCKYSSENETGAASGTVYVANGKMRIDFASNNGSETAEGHIIADSEYSYFWLDSNGQGIKTATVDYTEEEAVPAEENTSNEVEQSLNQTISYKCNDWMLDESKFTTPANITFTELTIPSGMPSVIPAGEYDNDTACAACDNLPAGETQDACRAQLNCN